MLMKNQSSMLKSDFNDFCLMTDSLLNELEYEEDQSMRNRVKLMCFHHLVAIFSEEFSI